MATSIPLKDTGCNLCQAKEEETVFRSGKANIVRCKKCGLFYRRPRSSDEDEIKRYRDQVYDGSYWKIMNDSKKEIFISILKKIGDRKGKILDIGCADGFFLTLAREKGWEPYGIEISDSLFKQARERLGKEHVFGLPLRMANFEPDFFEVVTMWDVLDHLTDPLGELREIRKILKKKGLLILRVRNMSYHLLAHKLFKENLLGMIERPAIFHLYGFNNQNLGKLLRKANFSCLKIQNSALTKGDPYFQGKFRVGLSLNFIKKIYYAMSQIISFISSNRILISPSLIAYAS